MPATEAQRAAKKKYRQSAKGRATEKAYQSKPHVVAKKKSYQHQYHCAYRKRPEAIAKDRARYHAEPLRRALALARGKEQRDRRRDAGHGARAYTRR